MSNLPYLDKVLGQLSIVPKDEEEKQELEQVLLHRLCYPCTQLAQLHMQSNRMGILDSKKSIQVLNMSQQNIAEKPSIRKCKCCGFYRQQQTLGICTSLYDINNVGVNSHLFFITVTHTTIAFLAMLIIFCIYAMISNVFSCNYNPANLKQQYQSAKYLQLVSEWIFNVSLLSNISCETSDKSYEIQCWLGLGFIFVVYFIFAAFKFRKLLIIADLKRESKSVQNLSVLIQNMPIDMTKSQLEAKLRQYQKSLSDLTVQNQKQIKIVKINRAAPFYLSSSLFGNDDEKRANQNYEASKKKIVDLVKYRMWTSSFQFQKGKRQLIYDEFENAKKQRLEVFKKSIQANVQEAKEASLNQIVTAPTFVTFQSNFNKNFLLQMHTGWKIFFDNKNCFHFKTPNSTQKFRAIIKDPPRPEQIIWTNMGQKNRDILLKKLGIFIFTILFLVGTGAGLYYIQAQNFEYSVKNQGKRSTMYLSFVVSISIIVFTYLIAAILVVLSMKERNVTFMEQQASLNNKVILCQVGHFIIVPLVFHLFFKVQYTGIVSLSQTVFFLSLQSAFIFPLFKIFDPIYLYNRIRRRNSKKPENKIGLTQVELNKNFQYLQFGLGFHFSYIIRSILFTCFYAALQPVIVVFAIAGFIITYWVFKYCLFYRSGRPISGNSLVNISLNKYTSFGPILFGIGSLVWPYYIKKQFVGLIPSILQIILSFILYLIPLQSLIQKLVEKIQKKSPTYVKQILYSQNRANFDHQYDRLNYMTAHQANQKYLKQKNNQKQTTNMGYLNIIGNVTGNMGFYDMLNDAPEQFNDIQRGNSSLSQKQGEQRMLSEYEQIVYSNKTNDSAILVQSIMDTIKSNFKIVRKKDMNTMFMINLGVESNENQVNEDDDDVYIHAAKTDPKRHSAQTSYEMLLLDNISKQSPKKK